jgi:hypothetical protein
MMNTGKCPKCEKLLTSVKIEPIDVQQGFQTAWHGVSLSCPWCRAILSVSIDPIAIKTDIVNEVVKALRKVG